MPNASRAPCPCNCILALARVKKHPNSELCAETSLRGGITQHHCFRISHTRCPPLTRRRPADETAARARRGHGAHPGEALHGDAGGGAAVEVGHAQVQAVLVKRDRSNRPAAVPAATGAKRSAAGGPSRAFQTNSAAGRAPGGERGRPDVLRARTPKRSTHAPPNVRALASARTQTCRPSWCFGRWWT